MKLAARLMHYTCLSTALITALFSVPVFADEEKNMEELIRTGQFDAALAQTNAFLVDHPHDAPARLFKGSILSEQGYVEEAMAIYSAMTDEFPELAEPYNNLAVLLTDSGQYEKARNALETAIRINPHYAVAQENLGDLYAKMAIRSYAKALQTVPENAVLKMKVTQVHKLFNTTDGAAEQTTHADKTKSLSNTIATATPAAAPAPAVSDKRSTSSTPAGISPEQDRVWQTIKKWAAAWSNRDLRAYFGFYASDFETPDGLSRPAWETQRRTRINSKHHIEVDVTAPSFSIGGNTATVTFQQHYVADTINQENRKTLMLAKHDDAWQIVQERSDN